MKFDSIATIGPMIRAARKKQKLTQKEFAEKAGVGKTVVWDVENGKETSQVDTVLKIIQAAGIELLILETEKEI